MKRSLSCVEELVLLENVASLLADDPFPRDVHDETDDLSCIEDLLPFIDIASIESDASCEATPSNEALGGAVEA